MIYTLTLNPAVDRELTVPEIIYDDVLRACATRVDWGGKGFNVSRALAAWGEATVALGFVGGPTGQRIAAGLSELGIHTDFVQVAGETRTNVSIVSQSQRHHIKVNEPGPAITPADEAALLAKVRALAAAGDWWVLSGSIPPGASATIYARVTQAVEAAGAGVALDTSGDPLRHGCLAGPFLAKPNAAEAAELVGRPVASPDDACAVVESIHALGVVNLLISLGRRGAVLSDGAHCWLARPPQIVERNPVGAGDAMLAGLVWKLSHGASWPEALRWGVASGAATASLDGTAVGSYEQVEALAGQVELEHLPGPARPG
ncbi:MAG TPA: 1-phosphofructokinase [Anaerolineae bacterium]|nr:1-phosphofructokinase [Anaerolineae bacterium]HOQ99866.1 1-phosphofructokinase [Anaerolineae bacterium]HPL30145.1 1-phosphofructokinase [Anaerolineae bacterium]